MVPIHMIFVFLGALFQRQGELATENLALPQQLGVLEHMYKRPRSRMTPIKGGGIATPEALQNRDSRQCLGAGGQRTPHY